MADLPGSSAFTNLFKGLFPPSDKPEARPGVSALATLGGPKQSQVQFFQTQTPPPTESAEETVSNEAVSPTFFSDARKFLFPTFEEQMQAVQNEARASLLPEVARELAFKRDQEMAIARTPQRNPQTGKLELTGLGIDPFIGAAKRVGIQGLKIGVEKLGEALSGVVGKSAKEIESALPKVVEGTVDSIKTLAKKLVTASSPEEAAKVVRSEVSFFSKAASKTPDLPGGGKPKSVSGVVEESLPVPKKFEPIEVPRNFTKQAEKTAFSEADVVNLTRRLDVLGLGTRSVRTFEEVEQAAQFLGTDIQTLLRSSVSKPISDVEAQALKNTIASANRLVADSQKAIARDPSLEATLGSKVQEAERLIDESLKKLVPGVTEVGRALNALRMQANQTLDPSVWFVKAQRMLGPRELTPEMRGIITNLIENGDRVGLAQYVSMLRTASWAEKAATLWKAGLLTAFRTHEANILGNTTMAGLETATNVVSTGFDVLASLVTGKRTITFSPATVAAKVRGFGVGIQKGASYFKTGTYSSDILSKYEVRQVTFENKILNGYVKAVFRSLGAEDIVFREAAMQEAFVTQAEVIAKNEGLRGPGFKARVKELLTKPTNEMVWNAIDAAEYQTFQRTSKLAELITTAKVTLQNMDSPLAKWGGILLEFIAPFAKTPINIAKTIADYSPLGFVKAVANAIPPQSRSQKTFIQDISRAVVGTSFITLGAYLAKNGMMTGNAPTKTAERDMFYAQGMQPNSILVGQYWFRLNRISPLGNLLALGAEFEERGKDTEGVALYSATFWGGAKAFTDLTFLQGASSVLKAIQDPEAYSGRYTQSVASSLIPTIVGHTARAIDPRLRVPEGIWQALEAKTPFLSKQVPVRRDIFGNPVVSPGGATGIVNPFEPTLSKDNPVINEAKTLGISIGLPEATISNVKLDNAEFSIYQKVQGKILEKTLIELINSQGYQLLNATQKEKEFRNTITETRQQLNDVLFPALMIKRYDLPLDTNPQLVRLGLSALGKEDAFKRMSTQKQGKALRSLLQILQIPTPAL